MMHILITALILLFVTIAQAEEATRFRWARDIEHPEITATTLVSVPLDSHFFQFTREGRPDVRLIDDRSEPLGFVIRIASETKGRTIRSTWIATQTAAKVDPTHGLQIELSVGDKDPAPNGIRIVTPLRDFEQQVQIDSSADGTNWTPIGPPTVIFDYSRYVDARNDRVLFTTNDHRRFRVTINEITSEQQSQLTELSRQLSGGEETSRTEHTTVTRTPFRVDRIEFLHDEQKVESGEPRKSSYAALHFATALDQKNHQTVITFETQREPLTEIKLVTQAENFSRAATVEAEFEDTNGKSAWRSLTKGKLTRFAVGTIKREDLTLAINEAHEFRYRVIVDNADSPALSFTNADLSGPQYELMYLASPGKKVQLEYGSLDAPAGQFDKAALEAALSQNSLLIASVLQAPRENPNVKTEQTHAWVPWNDTRVLVGAIVAATLILGWGLFQASKRITLPPEQ